MHIKSFGLYLLKVAHATMDSNLKRDQKYDGKKRHSPLRHTHLPSNWFHRIPAYMNRKYRGKYLHAHREDETTHMTHLLDPRRP